MFLKKKKMATPTGTNDDTSQAVLQTQLDNLDWGTYAAETQEEIRDCIQKYQNNKSSDFNPSDPDNVLREAWGITDTSTVTEDGTVPGRRTGVDEEASKFLIGYFISEYLTLGLPEAPSGWSRCTDRNICEAIYTFPFIVGDDGQQYLPDTLLDNMVTSSTLEDTPEVTYNAMKELLKQPLENDGSSVYALNT